MKSLLIFTVCSSLLMHNYTTVFGYEEFDDGEEIIIENTSDEGFIEPNEIVKPDLHHRGDYSINDIPVYDEGSDAVGIEVEYHSIGKIKEYYAAHPISYMPASYVTEPNTQIPYAPGELSPTVLNDALDTVNLLRYIAGLDYDVELFPDYNEKLQAGSLINAVNDKLSHKPVQPEGMDDALFRSGYDGNLNANIAKGFPSLGKAIVNGWLRDDDSENIKTLGHRRWLLNAQMQSTGFGQVGDYSGMYSHNSSRDSARSSNVWPAQNTPIEFFDADDPWSISTGRVEDNISDITVKMENVKSHEIKTFSSTSSDGYFAVNNDYYGAPGAIIWKPDNITVAEDVSYEITITGTSLGRVNYIVSFFKLDYSDEQLILTPSELSLDTGASKTVTASFIPATSSDSLKSYNCPGNNTIVSISYSNYKFTIKGLKPGSTTLRVTSKGGNRGYCYITVNGIIMSPESLEIPAGTQEQLTAEIFPNNPDQVYQWTSSDESIATVDGNGMLTARSAGTARITASANGYSAYCDVTVTKNETPVSSITLTPETLSLNKGQSSQLNATVLPADAGNKDIVWTSSNETAATVDTNGMVTGLSAGTAVIRAASAENNEIYAECTVTVTDTLIDTTFSHSCSFNNNLTINYYFNKTDLEGYENLWLEIRKQKYEGAGEAYGWETYTVSKYTDEETEYKFTFSNIAAKEMGDAVIAVLHGQKDGKDCQSEEDQYGISVYAYNRLKKSTDAKFKTLLVDMLNYGAKAQSYFGYNTGHPVNAELTDEQRALGTAEVPELTPADRVIETEGATAEISGKSVIFQSNTVLKYYMKLAEDQDMSKVKLVLSYTSLSGTEMNKTIKGSSFTYEEKTDEYSAKLSTLSAKDISSVITAKIYNGNKVISDVLEYSMETYVYNKLRNSTDENFKALLREFAKYCFSAKEYFKS